jgi:shikimate 5-dehydrogenase
MTTPYAEVIGDPISHSKSPLIHRFWLGKLGIAGDYRATHVAAADLAGYIDTRRNDPNWRGCNVTIPHKIAIMDHVGDPGDEARTRSIAWTILGEVPLGTETFRFSPTALCQAPSASRSRPV